MALSLERIDSGIPGLDEILGGGFPDASINLICGSPGVGKTVMVEQIIFSGASESRPAIYYSTVAEPSEKIVAHVQSFNFYRRDLISQAIHFSSLGETLCRGGLTGVLETIRADTTRIFPRYLVIDSFRAFRDFSGSAGETARFLYELTGILSALRCTTFLLDESPMDRIMRSPMAAVADSIVCINNTTSGRADRRWVQILKLRGSSFQSGSHFLVIDSHGLTVYPRFGSCLGPCLPDANPRALVAPCSTGLEALDLALGGGLARGSVVLVTGAPGTGKTVFGLQFLFAGVLAGEPGVFVSTQETPAWLRRTAANLGWDFEVHSRNGAISVAHVPPLGVEVDRLGHDLLRLVDQSQARRVVLDAITDLDTAAMPEDDYQGFLYSLSQLLKARGVTTALTASRTVARDEEDAASPFANRMADAMVHLELRLCPHSAKRSLHVLKTRGCGNGVTRLPFAIKDRRGLIMPSPETGADQAGSLREE